MKILKELWYVILKVIALEEHLNLLCKIKQENVKTVQKVVVCAKMIQIVMNVLRVISRVTIMIVNHVKPHVTIVLLQKTVQHVILPTINGMML